MSFPTERQTKLNPVLEALGKIAGIESVQQDDFDSGGINVFFWLKPANQRHKSSPVMEFELPVAALKRLLKRTFKQLGEEFRVTDFPAMQTEHISVHDRSPGDPTRRKIGFDQERFGIEVYV